MLTGKESLQEVKDKLTSYGVSTSTPGLKGDERLQELVRRLEEIQLKENEFQLSMNQKDISEKGDNQPNYNVPSVSDLSLSEIRSRLAMLGENTNTLGLVGEERRSELLKRLINSICRSDDIGDQVMDEILQDNHTESQSQTLKVQQDSNVLPPTTNNFQPDIKMTENESASSDNSRIERMKKEERIKTTELSEIKKHMNGLINRRAMVISSRYEGVNQDEKLQKLTSLMIQIEQEIVRVENLLKKNRSGKGIHSSSPIIENNSMLPAEKLLIKLNKEFETIKEKIKRQKNKIKCEEENNPIYGLEIEEIDKIRIQELSYQISKIKRDIEKMAVGVSVADSTFPQQQDIESLDSKVMPTINMSPSINNMGESQSKAIKQTAATAPAARIESEGKGKGIEKEKKKKGSKAVDAFDLSPGSGVGLSEEELFSIKPFEPYKESDTDDLLALKMEMLRNRQKSTLVKKVESDIPSSDLIEKKKMAPQVGDEVSSKSDIQGSPEIGGSINTAFSTRRPVKIVPPPPKNDQTIITPTVATPATAATVTGATTATTTTTTTTTTTPSTLDRSSKIVNINSETMTRSDEKATNEKKLPPPDSKITRLRHELAQASDDSEEENEHHSEDDEEEMAAQLRSLRSEAVTMEKKNDFDKAEEIYVQALNLKPFDVRTLDAFATFLHRRKGEMGRAEAFYRRAIQICLPSLIDNLNSPSKKLNHDDWNKILSGELLFSSPTSQPEGGNSSLPVKRLTSVLLHYATFLRRAKGEVDLAEIVYRKAAEISPTDDVVLGNCAHHLAEEAYDHENSKDGEKIKETQREVGELFQRALKANPKNVNNMLWYAKFLHKTNQLIQAEIMFKAALKVSNLQGKVGATAICNYAIFLYRHKRDPEKAATLFCEGIERFPNHRGIQKGYKAMKKELEKEISQAHRQHKVSPPLPPLQEETDIHNNNNSGRENSISTAKMAGMRAKLYQDVQNAEDYQLTTGSPKKNNASEIGNDDDDDDLKEGQEDQGDFDDHVEDDGLFSFQINQLVCILEHQDRPDTNEFYVYWLFNAGTGSISDRSYESSTFSLEDILDWKFTSDENQLSPIAAVTCNDHLCFEFYLIKKIDIESELKKSIFIGSVIIPIEDLIHTNLLSTTTTATTTTKKTSSQSIHHYVEETIMSDEGMVIGKLELHFTLQ